MVPMVSGWPSWPIITICKPASWCRAASICTLVTSGQVASTEIIWRRAASAGTDFGTPWAEKITGRSGGHFVQFLDEDRAPGAQAVDHELVVHDLVAHIDRRAPFLDRHFDDLDRAVHAGAEAARGGEIEGERGLRHPVLGRQV